MAHAEPPFIRSRSRNWHYEGFVGGKHCWGRRVSAPVIAAYMHSRRRPGVGFIFAATVPFWVLGVVQVVPMTALDVYTSERVAAAILARVPSW